MTIPIAYYIEIRSIFYFIDKGRGWLWKYVGKIKVYVVC